MGKESLDKFFNKMAADSELKAKVKSFGGDADELVAFAKDQGYEFSAEELKEYQEKARELLLGRLNKTAKKPVVEQSPGVQAFFALTKLAESDEEAGKRLNELASGTPEELIAYGREKGFIFNEQDMTAIGKDILDPSDELSEEELELAAGGLVDVGLALVFVGCVLGLAAVGGVAVAGGAAAGGAAVGFVLALMKS